MQAGRILPACKSMYISVVYKYRKNRRKKCQKKI